MKINTFCSSDYINEFTPRDPVPEFGLSRPDEKFWTKPIK